METRALPGMAQVPAEVPADLPADLPAAVHRWVSDGLITSEQADRILAAERPATATETATATVVATTAGSASLVTEALAYVGGVIVLAAVSWVTAERWSSLTPGVRLALSGTATVLMLAAGIAVPSGRGEVATRLRSVLWLLSSAALAWFGSLLLVQLVDWSADVDALVVSVAALAYTATLWWWHRQPLQEAAVFVASSIAAATAAGQLPGGSDALPGAAISVVGVVWLVLALRQWLPSPRLGGLLGAVGAVAGAMTTGSYGWGNLLTAAVLVLLLTVALRVRSLPLLAVAAVGSLASLPRMMNRYFAGSLVVPLVLVVVGLVMIAAAIRLARRPEVRPPGTTAWPGRAGSRRSR